VRALVRTAVVARCVVVLEVIDHAYVRWGCRIISRVPVFCWPQLSRERERLAGSFTFTWRSIFFRKWPLDPPFILPALGKRILAFLGMPFFSDDFRGLGLGRFGPLAPGRSVGAGRPLSQRRCRRVSELVSDCRRRRSGQVAAFFCSS